MLSSMHALGTVVRWLEVEGGLLLTGRRMLMQMSKGRI